MDNVHDITSYYQDLDDLENRRGRNQNNNNRREETRRQSNRNNGNTTGETPAMTVVIISEIIEIIESGEISIINHSVVETTMTETETKGITMETIINAIKITQKAVISVANMIAHVISIIFAIEIREIIQEKKNNIG
jgi:hypothetical protein